MVAATLLLCAQVPAQAAVPTEPWEFRVCAPIQSPPMSSQRDGGFDNRIAEVLADEMGARLTYEWIRLGRDGLPHQLHLGDCDAFVGIGESVAGVMSTVPYLRTPYVFVTRAGHDLEVTSLDEPRLKELVVGTYPAGLPSIALLNRGITENVREISPVATPDGFDRETPILDALFEGTIDIAIVYGPMAAAHDGREPGRFQFVPVTPELDVGATILPMYRTWTIGVRPNDEVLRDRLNAALAARWDEINDVISSFGVPQLTVSRPSPAAVVEPGTVRVGVVAPAQTRRQHGREALGEPARRGANLAQNAVARLGGDLEVPFEVLFASAPTVAAAVRAAERLVATEAVVALVGGFGAEEALALAHVAEVRGVVFFNVGAADDALRHENCRPTTFHVEASTSMYIDALSRWFGSDGARWFVLYHDAGDGALVDRVVDALERFGSGAVVGSASVEPRQFVFFDLLADLRAAEPDVVLTIVGADELDQFLVQFEMFGLDATVATVPDQRAQTREMLVRLRQSAPTASRTPRPALWDTTLGADGNHPAAADLNERYVSRTGEPMEPSAWATYAAVMSVFDAARAGRAAAPADLVDHLRDPAVELDLGKGPGTSFRPWDHQLRQPLYMVEIDPEAPWGSRVSARVAIAGVIAEVPGGGAEVRRSVLDLIGDDEERSTCAF
jgi:ABC transporter substrate binding protein (PQQ-dependent alcohol dehydrogenase system)